MSGLATSAAGEVWLQPDDALAPQGRHRDSMGVADSARPFQPAERQQRAALILAVCGRQAWAGETDRLAGIRLYRLGLPLIEICEARRSDLNEVPVTQRPAHQTSRVHDQP